jgi:hypothetical protein
MNTAPIFRAPSGDSAEAQLAAVYDAFRIGRAAREVHTLQMCLSNALRRSECLSAIEREFFMVPTPPEEEDDGVWGEECLLNWGSDPAEYVEQFRAGLAHLAATGETS